MDVTPAFQAENVIRELSVIVQIVRTLKNAPLLSDSLIPILDLLIEDLLPVEAAAIFLWDRSSRGLKPAAARGYEDLHVQTLDLLPGKALARKVFSEGRATQVSDARTANQFAATLQAENQALVAQKPVEELLPASAVAAPIHSDQQKYGVLVVENYSGESTFQPGHFQVICLAADLIALAAGGMYLSTQGPGEPRTYRQEPVSLDMLDALGHELRLPLTAIKGFTTALLLEDVDWSPPKRKEFLQLIDEECDRMEVLLKNCLDSASGDFSELTLDRQTVSVADIASQVAAEIRARTTIHQIIVEFPAAFPQLLVDPNWVRQIFRNLLDNAVKYSPDGGLIVMRGSVRQADVLLSISDQGIGISPEDIIPLFERYHRAKISTDLGIPGKGLGLPITRMVVEAHGGRIWAYSRLGEGTTMYFTLPLDRMDRLEGKV